MHYAIRYNRKERKRGKNKKKFKTKKYTNA